MKKLIIFLMFTLLINFFVLGDTYNSTKSNNVIENAPTTVYKFQDSAYLRSENLKNRISYQQFDLSNSTGKSLSSAVLNLSVWASTSNIDTSVNLSFCNDVFNENTLTWNNRNTEVTSCVDVYNSLTTSFIAGNTYIINITEAVNNDIDRIFTIKNYLSPQNQPSARAVYFNTGYLNKNYELIIKYLQKSIYLNVEYPVINSSITFWNRSIEIYSNSTLTGCDINNTDFSGSLIDNNNYKFVNNTNIDYGTYYYTVNCSTSDSGYISNNKDFYIHYYEPVLPPSEDEEDSTTSSSDIEVNFNVGLQFFISVLLFIGLMYIYVNTKSPIIYMGMVLIGIGLSVFMVTLDNISFFIKIVFIGFITILIYGAR